MAVVVGMLAPVLLMLVWFMGGEIVAPDGPSSVKIVLGLGALAVSIAVERSVWPKVRNRMIGRPVVWRKLFQNLVKMAWLSLLIPVFILPENVGWADMPGDYLVLLPKGLGIWLAMAVVATLGSWLVNRAKEFSNRG